MRSLLSTSLAAVTAAGILLTPIALAAPAHAAPAKAYTVSVTGNGSTGSIVATSITVDGTTVGDPTVIAKPNARLPWKKRFSAKADLIQVVAVVKKGSRISCTIRDPKGKLVSRSTGYGKRGIATCIVASSDLAAGLGGLGSGSGGTPPAS